MQCNTIPTVLDSTGTLHESILYADLISNTGDREFCNKVYLATMTESFKNWFGNSEYIDDLGQPALLTDKSGNLVFVNENKETKVVFNRNSLGNTLTEKDVINDLIQKGIINKNRIHGKYVLPRPLQGSDYLENYFSNREKPETTASLEKIRKLNQTYREKYGIDTDIITVRPFGKTFSVSVNPSALSQISSRKSPSYALARKKKVGALPFDELKYFKENQIANLEERLTELSIRRQRPLSPDDYVKVAKTQNAIRERITVLKQEVVDIDNANSIYEIDTYVTEDLRRMERLAESDDYRDLEEAYEISRFYERSDPHIEGEHNLFTRDELFDPVTNDPLYSPYDHDVMMSWHKRSKEIRDRIQNRRKRMVEEQFNQNTSFQRAFKGKVLTADEIFSSEGLRDISTIDMWAMDTTNGIFSKGGIVPQMLRIALEGAESRANSFIKEKLERLEKVKEKAEDTIAGLDGGKYKLGRFFLRAKGVVWDIFYQRDADGKLTGNLNQRYSKIWYDAERSMQNTVNELEENGNYGQAGRKRRDFYANEAVIIDITTIPEIVAFINDPANGLDFMIPLIQNPGSHTTNATGNHLREIIEEQKKLLNKLKLHYEARIQFECENEGVNDYNSLSQDGKDNVNRWLIQNNPVYSYDIVKTSTPQYQKMLWKDPNKPQASAVSINMYSTFDYAVKVPRHNRIKPIGGRRVTNYYDSNFEVIDRHSDLYEFHEIAKELLDFYKSALPSDVQQNLPEGAIGLTQKAVSDVLFDPYRSFSSRTLEALKMIYRRFWKEAAWINKESAEYKGRVDPVTGMKIPKVNSSALVGLRPEIGKLFLIEKARFINAYNSTNTAGVKLSKLTKNTELYEISMNAASIAMIADLLEVPRDMVAIKNKLGISNVIGSSGTIEPAKIPVGRIIHNHVTNKVVQTTTMNLPKALEYFSSLAAQYAAKTEVKPFADAAMEFYKKIKNTATTSTGEVQSQEGRNIVDRDEYRTKAIRQIESWYQRAVLGNYGTKEVRQGSSLYYTEEEEKQIAQIDAQLANLGTTPEEIQLAAQLEGIKKEMGHAKSWTKRGENLLAYIRLLGLGWNLDSSITNFLEGQIGNEIAMTSGLYYSVENWYKATKIVRLARRRALSRHRINHPMANLVSILMNRYTVLQDSRNELQKANIKTSFSIFEKLDPMLLNQAVEYLNQSPILVTALMDEKINDINGNTVSLWEAFDTSTGKLKSEFRTPENIKNWEQMSGGQYEAFKVKLNKVIVETHGDYDRLRGNLAKTTFAGKAAFMFKGWLPRAIYMRFGVEQLDIETGRVHKGRYRSHTAATATLHGAIIGMSILTPLMGGPLIAAGIGIAAGVGVRMARGKFSDTRTDIGYVKELALSTMFLAQRMIGHPVNRLLNRNVIKMVGANTLEDLGFGGKNFTETDRKNLLANLSEMAIELVWIALILLVKMKWFDDDDEKDAKDRMIHNLLINRFIQMSQQATMYLNPVNMYQDNITSLPLIRFANNVMVLANDFQNALEGENVDMSPYKRGENKLLNSLQKFVPSPGKDLVGFGSDTERQFQKTYYDRWFESKLSRKIDEIDKKRASVKEGLKSEGVYTSDEIDRIMASKYPTLDAQVKRYKKKQKNSYAKDPVYFLTTPETLPEYARLLDERKEKKKKAEEEKNREIIEKRGKEKILESQ